MAEGTVQDLLNAKGSEVIWIEPLESVFTAARTMKERKIGALLVQIDGFIVGILTERDFMTKFILGQRAAHNTRVSEIMTRDVIKVTREDTIDHCLHLMKEHDFRHLPVVEDGHAVGIISLRDLFLVAIQSRA